VRVQTCNLCRGIGKVGRDPRKPCGLTLGGLEDCPTCNGKGFLPLYVPSAFQTKETSK
jgi:DnaJ-class molecular chaperone